MVTTMILESETILYLPEQRYPKIQPKDQLSKWNANLLTLFEKKNKWAGEIKLLAFRHDHLASVSEPYIEERENPHLSLTSMLWHV